LHADNVSDSKSPQALAVPFEVSNIEVSTLYVYVSLMGQIHQQVNGLPPGIKITDVKIE